MLSPIEQNLAKTLSKLLSLAEMDLLMDILDSNPEEFYEGICIEFIRLYPDEAKELFGDLYAPHKEEKQRETGNPHPTT